MRPRRIAIMQPYLFPYLGYFQLARAVDEFWLLDTVAFIPRGWMNRNAVRAGDRRSTFTIPMAAAPRDTPICSRAFHADAGKALARLLRQIRHGYARAPHRDRALELVERVTGELRRTGSDFTRLTEFALARTFDALGIATPIRRISELALDPTLTGQDRIISACRTIGTQEYLNMIGGSVLYDAARFAEGGIVLMFLEAALPPYVQNGKPFLPGLSILDALAHVAPGELPPLLEPRRIEVARVRNA